uniref:DUF4283 domain-containing protein n=1 Tax=Setaria viridis TaxID=4556 RepID=A0A4U6VIN9_SETVI|nr:LOW QUALITY PROTEIN: hypothetical protein SEVIR_3G249900v2 [Setaria viridis]
MATYPVDSRVQLELAACAISATGAIKGKRETLIGKTAVCWLNGNSHDTAYHHVIDALDKKLQISRHDVKVVKHFPEQYIIFFADSRAYHCTVQHREVPHRGRIFNFEPWTERRRATESMLEFRDCTRTYDLWAWCANPSKIPNKVLLTVSNPDKEQDLGDNQHIPPRGYKGGYNYKLHVHLDVVEDLSFNGGLGGEGNRKPRHEFLLELWRTGLPGRRGQDHDDCYGRKYRPRKDNHDDHNNNFHRGQRRQRSQSSWGKMTRCRGATEDCYSTNRRRSGNRGPSGRN